MEVNNIVVTKASGHSIVGSKRGQLTLMGTLVTGVIIFLPDVLEFAPDYAPMLLLGLIALFAVAILGYSIQDREDTRQKGQLEIEKVKLEQMKVQAQAPKPLPVQRFVGPVVERPAQSSTVEETAPAPELGTPF